MFTIATLKTFVEETAREVRRLGLHLHDPSAIRVYIELNLVAQFEKNSKSRSEKLLSRENRM